MGSRPSWSGLGPELEQLAFRIGIKPALRVLVPAHRVGALREHVAGVAIVEEPYRAGTAVLYVARDREHAEALRRAEAAVAPSAASRAPDAEVRAAHREVGRLLGYPRCCVDAYIERLARGVEVRRDGSRAAESVVAAEAALHASREALARLNSLVSRPLVPFLPCRFDCETAARYADALFLALSSRRPDEAKGLRAALSAPVRLSADGTRLEPRDPAPPALELRFDRF